MRAVLTNTQPTRGNVMVEDFESTRIASFFGRVTEHFGRQPKPASILVTHMLADGPPFAAAVAQMTSIAVVLPKPKSVSPAAQGEISRFFRCDRPDRAALADPARAVQFLEAHAAGRDLVLLDVGGYFAPALATMCSQFSGRLLGVVEDTENGLAKYLRHGKLPCPVFSVARSPLKEPEDHLVGQSVVFSTEALIRGHGGILPGRPACVVGFGKIGMSAASTLRARGVQTVVCEIDPVRRTRALAQGFRVTGDLAEAFRGVGLAILATGSLSMRADAFAYLPNGTYVASVTSSDDELDLAGLAGLYTRDQVAPLVTRFSAAGRCFYLLNDGNAVNFVHGGSAAHFIHLVQAEILAGVAALANGPREPGLHEVSPDDRKFIAATWLRQFDEGVAA